MKGKDKSRVLGALWAMYHLEIISYDEAWEMRDEVREYR
jgi:hypothetical protein